MKARQLQCRAATPQQSHTGSPANNTAPNRDPVTWSRGSAKYSAPVTRGHFDKIGHSCGVMPLLGWAPATAGAIAVTNCAK